MAGRRSKAWLDANTAWRLAAIAQIQQWVADNNQGPYDLIVDTVVVRRFAKLELFVWSFFPDAPPAPFSAQDAAALIVLPRCQALRLARVLFSAGPGIAADLTADDLTFNMDWFHPKGWF